MIGGQLRMLRRHQFQMAMVCFRILRGACDDAVGLERLDEAEQRLRPTRLGAQRLDRAVAGEAAEAPSVFPLRDTSSRPCQGR